MGYAKDQWIREQEQGWDYVSEDLFVCADCFDDSAIEQFIKYAASKKECSYCKKKAKTPIAASMNSVLEIIGDGITWAYEDPVHHMPFEDGEYVFPPLDAEDVFDEIGWPTSNGAVEEEIRNAFGGRSWVEKDFFGLSEDDQLRYGWQDFVKAVKHQTRYLFSSVKRPREKYDLDENIPPDRMLDSIGKVVRDVGLVHKLKKGAQWFRVRVHDPRETYTTASELGTVPESFAVYSNRMSPAGIPMFYGAGDEKTAIAETYTQNPGQKSVASVGVFETAREMQVLDLTDLPMIPSLFDENNRHLRPAIKFLKAFVADLTKPIAKDGREHIEYIPTQIMTEYFRHVFKTEAGKWVQGILYRSSQNGAGVCCVLFFKNEDCCDVQSGWESDQKKWLGLTSVTREELN